MELSLDDVRHIAILARIGLSDADLLRFQHDLSGILSHIQELQQIDTAGVPPTANGADLLNVTASDEPTDSLPREDVLANAPAQEDGYFRVRAVLE